MRVGGRWRAFYACRTRWSPDQTGLPSLTDHARKRLRHRCRRARLARSTPVPFKVLRRAMDVSDRRMTYRVSASAVFLVRKTRVITVLLLPEDALASVLAWMLTAAAP